MQEFGFAVAGLIGVRLLAQLGLDWINRRHAVASSGAASTSPDRSLEYTLAKSRAHSLELVFDAVVLLLFLFTGFLPWLLGVFTQTLGGSAWSMALFLMTAGIALSLTGLPFGWHSQFRVEESFGFNTMTLKLWIMDRVKGFGLAVILGFPLIWLILKIVEWTGSHWWLWGWCAMMGFQFLMIWLAPALIMPLFNTFTPLEAGPLKDQLLELANTTGFAASSIQLMDGSRRSRHSNAFFTGFGRLRKIVLFDTLVQQLTTRELQAVLAHEIGHYKRGHIPKLLCFSALSALGGFALLQFLAGKPWFLGTFGLPAAHIAPAFLLFVVLGDLVTFWFSPLSHAWSRRYEYQADAFAAGAMGDPQPLIAALRKLNEKNLGNLHPHPLYSMVYHSHPTLLERETALAAHPKTA